MSEILKKWDAFCKDATVKFGANETVEFCYAVVKITDRINEPVVFQEPRHGGGTFERSEHNYSVTFDEIRSVTQAISGGQGTFSAGVGKSKLDSLIVGSRAVVIYASYPQSENKSALTSLAIIHLKTGTCYGRGGFNHAHGGIEAFKKTHNLRGDEPVLNSGNIVLPIQGKNYFKHARNSLFATLAFLALGLLPTKSIDNFLPSALQGAIAAIVLCGLLGAIAALLLFSVLSLRNKMRGNATWLASYLMDLNVAIFNEFTKDAPALWRELESNS